MSLKIIDKRKITISEAKELLEKIENLNLFQLRIMDYVKKFSKIEPITAKELVEKLITNFEIEREDAITIINCMPTSIEELRVFFSRGMKRLILTSKLEEMLKFLDDYR